jgi:hypothetical protein
MHDHLSARVLHQNVVSEVSVDRRWDRKDAQLSTSGEALVRRADAISDRKADAQTRGTIRTLGMASCGWLAHARQECPIRTWRLRSDRRRPSVVLLRRN